MSRQAKELLALSFSVDAERLHHAFRFVRDDATQKMHEKFPALARVLIEPHPKAGVYMIGCDGGLMVVQFDPTGTASAPFCIGLRADERSMLHGDGLRRRTLSLESEGEFMTLKTVGQRGTEIRSNDIEHGNNYPKWRSILPDWSELRPGVPGMLNAHYLSRLVAMANPGQEMQKHFRMYCAVCGNQPEKAAVIFFPFNSNMLAILMPMTGVLDEQPAQPAWLNASFDPADDL